MRRSNAPGTPTPPPRSWPARPRRGPLDRREDRERQGVHVDVVDQLIGGVGLEEPVQKQRAGRVGTGLA